ncbi:hypothetical protein [Rubritalea tangerina]
MSSRKSVIPKSWSVSPVIRQRVGASVGRQRLIEEDGEILVLLHMVPKAEDKGEREPALFWHDGQGNWKSSPSSGGRSELRTLVESYQSRINALDAAMEEADDPEVIHNVIDEATPVVRAGRHVAQVVSELRKALREDLDILATRDMAVQMERSGDLVLQDAKSSLDFMVAKNTVVQAKESHKAAKEAQKLNRLAAFFFPLMTIAAVFGMNPVREVLSHAGIWAALVVGLVLGAIVRGALKRSE